MKELKVIDVRPAYTHYLNMRKINRMARNKNVSKKEMVTAITKMVEPAIDTYVKNGLTLQTKKVAFLHQINYKNYSKQSIVKRCNTALRIASVKPALQNNRPELLK